MGGVKADKNYMMGMGHVNYKLTALMGARPIVWSSRQSHGISYKSQVGAEARSSGPVDDRITHSWLNDGPLLSVGAIEKVYERGHVPHRLEKGHGLSSRPQFGWARARIIGGMPSFDYSFGARARSAEPVDKEVVVKARAESTGTVDY